MTASMDLARHPAATSHLSDDQLRSLRAQLMEELAEQRRQLDENEALFDVIAAGDDETVHDRELVRVAAERAAEAIAEIEAALGRLDAGTYGTCASCGRPIPVERLEAIPHAEHCVACLR